MELGLQVLRKKGTKQIYSKECRLGLLLQEKKVNIHMTLVWQNQEYFVGMRKLICMPKELLFWITTQKSESTKVLITFQCCERLWEPWICEARRLELCRRWKGEKKEWEKFYT